MKQPRFGPRPLQRVLISTASPRPLQGRATCLRLQPQTRTFLKSSRSSPRAYEALNVNNLRTEAIEYHIRRRNFLLAGAVSGAIAFAYTAYLLYKEVNKPKKFDSKLPENLSADPFSTEAGSKRKTVVHDAEGNEFVPTGNTVVPAFPRTLDLSIGGTDAQEKAVGVEYTLVGLGMRSVSFIGINVYLVGFYIATSDIAAIQARLVKEINPIATTLVASEKDELRAALMDPVHGEKIWNDILREVAPRTVFRIVPVRDTDFHHLRDGFVRAITGRTQLNPAEYGGEDFGSAMRDFRTVFNRGSVPKRKELLLARDNKGVLTILFDDGKNGLGTVGRIQDERIAKALWLNYLGGKKVASEPARANIVEGIMEFVERPVGTVATQVL